MNDHAQISEFLQKKLRVENMPFVAAVEAARWLSVARLLKDSKTRPGAPLRKLLRTAAIAGKRQAANQRWYIDLIARR